MFNVNGDVNYAPNGEYTGTFSTSGTTLAEGVTYFPKAPSSNELSDEGKTDKVIAEYLDCVSDKIFDFVKINGLGGRIFKPINSLFKLEKTGVGLYGLYRDVRSGDFVAVLFDLTNFVKNVSCAQALVDIITPVQAY